MTTEDKASPADAGPISSDGLGLAPERAPAAWADDHAIAGEVGNCASSAAKAYWLRSHWVDQKRAARLRHPLYSQAQLDVSVAAERERMLTVAWRAAIQAGLDERLRDYFRGRFKELADEA